MLRRRLPAPSCRGEIAARKSASSAHGNAADSSASSNAATNAAESAGNSPATSMLRERNTCRIIAARPSSRPYCNPPDRPCSYLCDPRGQLCQQTRQTLVTRGGRLAHQGGLRSHAVLKASLEGVDAVARQVHGPATGGLRLGSGAAGDCDHVRRQGMRGVHQANRVGHHRRTRQTAGSERAAGECPQSRSSTATSISAATPSPKCTK